ncbi:MAG: hypothetical protein LWW97_03015 [Deltaproteobacteria bacterium]|nr:hypothetical protein [Deltaproteobacteria bacterium]
MWKIQVKQKADRIEKFLAKNEPKIGSGGKEIQSNVTDNESARPAIFEQTYFCHNIRVWHNAMNYLKVYRCF